MSDPVSWKAVFVGGPHFMTATDVFEMFKSDLAPTGSNARAAEVKTISYFRDWLLEVEG